MKTIKLRKTLPNLLKLPLLMISFLLFTVSCSKEPVDNVPMNEQEPTIMDALASFNTTAKHANLKSDEGDEPTFEILSVALAKTKLASVVSKNRLTVFAPTDEAFMAAGITKKNVADIPNIKNILLYHVLPQPVFSYDLSSGPVTTAEGTDVVVNVSDSGVMVNDAMVTAADIKARNGVIHVINKVLTLPTGNLVETALSQAPEFSVLVAAVQKAGLVDTLAEGGPFTVFAPTNQAFIDLFGVADADAAIAQIDSMSVDEVTAILLYHVLPGYVFSYQLSNGYATTANGAAVNVNLDMAPQVYINDSEVVAANIQATNGLIHVIDKVLLPPTMNLVDTAASYDPEFSVLLAAATKAGLVDVLKGEGPYPQLTVFAPTNQAFVDFLGVADADEAIATIDTLPVDTLQSILLYHVVEGRVYSSDLSSGAVTTLNGDFDLDLGTLTINGSVQLVPELLNVQATNGVIHVINGVLTP